VSCVESLAIIVSSVASMHQTFYEWTIHGELSMYNNMSKVKLNLECAKF
jgi:hypothetical protein